MFFNFSVFNTLFSSLFVNFRWKILQICSGIRSWMLFSFPSESCQQFKYKKVRLNFTLSVFVKFYPFSYCKILPFQFFDLNHSAVIQLLKIKGYVYWRSGPAVLMVVKIFQNSNVRILCFKYYLSVVFIPILNPKLGSSGSSSFIV